MSQFVLDCSVSLSWCFADEVNDYADSVLNSLQTCNALVPNLWAFEAANVLLVAERRNRITPAQSIRAITLLQALPIYMDSIRSLDHHLLAFIYCFDFKLCTKPLTPLKVLLITWRAIASFFNRSFSFTKPEIRSFTA